MTKQITNRDILAEIKIVQNDQQGLTALVSRQGEKITTLELWKAEKAGEDRERAANARDILANIGNSSQRKMNFDNEKLITIIIIILGLLGTVLAFATQVLKK
ncbi:MAG: hypothetical protein NVS1B10_01570 [Candidatus Saccharimonadales bacterium]